MYKLKKMWFAFWQKYKLKNHLKLTSKLLMIFLITWLVGGFLTILSQWAFTDNFQGTPFQLKYVKYFWPVIIELVSGYDINEGYLNLNMVSNVLSIMVVITGIFIFAIFTGQIVSMFIHVAQRMNYLPEKPEGFSFNRPLLICGINEKLHNIIVELRKSVLTRDREIVIVDDDAERLKVLDKSMYRDVWYVKGDRANRDVLARAVGKIESAAIILTASDTQLSGNRYADSRAIESALAIEGYREKTHTVLELIDERNIPHLKHTKINEWISILEYGIKLTAQATLQHGMGSIYYSLLGTEQDSGKGSRIHLSMLSRKLEGLTYDEIRLALIRSKEVDMVPIGFARFILPEAAVRLKMDPGNTSYINQVNPISLRCVCCGNSELERDSLERVRRVCPRCRAANKERGGPVDESWYFSRETRLNLQDKLIYLADAPVDLEHFNGEPS